MTALIRRILSIPPEGYPPEIQRDLWHTAGAALLWCGGISLLGVGLACLLVG